MSRSPRVLVAVACIAAGVIGTSAGVGAATAPSGPFRPPVTGPVSRPFQAPDGPYGVGHRGLDYGVVPGDSILAIGGGVVVFAGQVGGRGYVTVLHPNGLRSSYSFVAGITVSKGQRVATGARLAAATERFMLSIRSGDIYLDPATLISAGPAAPPRHAHLVRGVSRRAR